MLCCTVLRCAVQALNAELVVTFEGTTEFGNPFMSRRSYLPQDLHWGERLPSAEAAPRMPLYARIFMARHGVPRPTGDSSPSSAHTARWFTCLHGFLFAG